MRESPMLAPVVLIKKLVQLLLKAPIQVIFVCTLTYIHVYTTIPQIILLLRFTIFFLFSRADLVAIAERMGTVKHKILILSGKGGVGKSTFSAQLSFALAAMDHQVGLLDIDICGPSIPKMLGLEGQEIHQSNLGWSPVYVDDSIGVMSIGFMLPDPDDAVIWRGPRKNGIITQFLKDVYSIS